jgi:hypothetical protein
MGARGAAGKCARPARTSDNWASRVWATAALITNIALIDRAPSGEIGERHLPLGLNQVDDEAAPIDGL